MGLAADRISISAAGHSHSIVGHIAISATELMTTHYLLPIIKSLRSKAPELQVEIIASNQVSDLQRREADIAIRRARPKDGNLIIKRLRDNRARLFASSTYINDFARPLNAADVASMTFVGSENHEQILGPLISRGLQLTSSNFNFHSASGTVLLELIRQGFGVGLLPREIAEKYEELEEVWSEFEPIPIETWLVSHRELRTNPRIRLVFDLLADGLG